MQHSSSLANMWRVECKSAQEDVRTEQEITWLPERWVDTWRVFGQPESALQPTLEEYARQDTIRRSFIYGLDDPLELFAASMAWGFGDDRRGLYRLGKMLARSRDGAPVIDVITDIVDTTRNLGARAGFSALFTGSRPRLPYLGIAFGTKLVHFAGYTQTKNGSRPMILDARVHNAGTRLEPEAPIPNPRRRVSSERYEEYCAWCEGQGLAELRNAGWASAEPVSVEWVLFKAGGKES